MNRVHSFKSWQLIFSSSLLLSYLWHRHEIQSNYTEYTPLIISHDSWHYLLRNLLKYNYTQKHLVLSFHSIYFITGQSGAYLSNYTLTLEKDALTGRPDWGKFRYSFIHIYKYLEKSKKSFLNLSEYLTLNQCSIATNKKVPFLVLCRPWMFLKSLRLQDKIRRITMHVRILRTSRINGFPCKTENAKKRK